MPIEPLVTIAMPARNAARTLGLTIASLRLQTYTRWELLLIDDGSTDATRTVAERFDDARVRVLGSSQGLGLAARLNQAIELATGPLIARLDADDVAWPERLARQVAFLLANPAVDLVGTRALVFSDDGAPVGLLPSRETHAQICARPWQGFYLAHPTWMGRAEWFRRHRYDPARLRAQDQDLLLRAYTHSRFATLPEVLTGYRQDRVTLGKSLRGRYHFGRAVAAEAVRRRAWLALARGATMQVAKGTFDTIALSTGMGRRMLRHRALPVPSADRHAWAQVWTACHDELGRCAV